MATLVSLWLHFGGKLYAKSYVFDADRETALLYDGNVSSDYNRQGIATVIAHELAHQW